MKKFTIIFIYIIMTIGYLDLLFEMVNAKDTAVNYFGLLTIPTYLWITKIIYNKIYKRNEKTN